MPARASKAALDAFIDNQISTLRWSRAEGQRLYSALSRVHAQAVDRLLTNQFVQKYVLHPSAADGALTPYARQAIGARVRELETWATKLYAEEWKHTGVRLQRFAGEQARFGLEFLSGAIPTKVDWIMPSVEALRGIVWSSPMSGAVLGQWASKLKSNVFRTLESSLVDGLVAGETVRDLTRRVMDSTLTRTRHEAEAIARTAAIHTSNQSLAALYAENSDVVEGEQWVATLDDRTCPICGPRDGVVYPLGQSVRPPAHFNCRCVMAPALREPFAGTELRAARPEFGGPGPYRDYVSWLKSQPDPVVLAHVGEEGARALANGSLTSSKRAFQMALAQPPTKVLPTESQTIGASLSPRVTPAPAAAPIVDVEPLVDAVRRSGDWSADLRLAADDLFDPTYDAPVQRAMERWLSSLSAAETKAIRTYSGAGMSYEFNVALREAGGDVKAAAKVLLERHDKPAELMRLLDSALAKGDVVEDTVTVFRGATTKPLLRAAGVSSPGAVPVGTAITDAGYASTTLQPSVAAEFGDDAVFIIDVGRDVPRGYIRTLASSMGEHELLLGRNTVFETIAPPEKIGGKWVYRMRARAAGDVAMTDVPTKARPSRLSDLDWARPVDVDAALEADLTKLMDRFAYDGIEPDAWLQEKVGRALSTGQVTVQDYRLLQYELHSLDIRSSSALARVEAGGRLEQAARELLRYRDQFGGYLANTAEDVAAGRSVSPMAMRNLRYALERRNLLVYEGLDLPGGGRVVPPPVVPPPKPVPPKPEKTPKPARVKKSRIAASVEPPAVTPANVARDGAVDVDELLSRPEFRARERQIDELLNRLYGAASRSPATRDRLLGWRLQTWSQIDEALSGDYATVSQAIRKIEEQRIATLKALLGEQLSLSEATSAVGRHLNVENLKVDVVTGDGQFKRRAIGDLLSGNRTVAGLARAAGVYEEALQRTVDALDTSLGFLRGVVDRLVANGAKVARVSKVGVQLERGIRAKFRPPWRGSGGFVFLGIGNGPRTAVHEFGHWIEVSFPQVRSKVVAFLRKRTRGESLVRLMDLFPDANYDALEKTRPDKFYSAYVGKDYGSYGVASKQLTEVLSMGLELFFTDPVAFYRADPEHFRLILSIVRGLV